MAGRCNTLSNINTEMPLTKKIGYTNETVAMLLGSKFWVISNMDIMCI